MNEAEETFDIRLVSERKGSPPGFLFLTIKRNDDPGIDNQKVMQGKYINVG